MGEIDQQKILVAFFLVVVFLAGYWLFQAQKTETFEIEPLVVEEIKPEIKTEEDLKPEPIFVYSPQIEIPPSPFSQIEEEGKRVERAPGFLEIKGVLWEEKQGVFIVEKKGKTFVARPGEIIGSWLIEDWKDETLLLKNLSEGVYYSLEVGGD